MTDIQDTSSQPTTEPAQDPPATSNSAALASAPIPVDRATLLDELITSIRAAVLPEASAQARAAGAAACRTILAALDTPVGQPLANAPPAATSPISPLRGLLSQLASMSREEIFEFLRDKFPAGASPGKATQPPAAPRFPLIPLPQVPLRKSGAS